MKRIFRKRDAAGRALALGVMMMAAVTLLTHCSTMTKNKKTGSHAPPRENVYDKMHASGALQARQAHKRM